MLSLLLLVFLFGPAWAQPPSASASPAEHVHDEHCEHEHELTEEEILHRHHQHGQEEVEAGSEYTSAGLHAQVENAPALYKFMIRESNSEPFRLKGQSVLVWRDTAVVCALNLVIIFWFYRRRQ
ncbi:hypothetical protein DYH09_20845 [bacterium CPR1]|nr:hypothetical protein [bacterium CPR1]